MTKNASSMRAELGLKEQVGAARAEGVWQAAPGGPTKVAFKKVWSGHEFSDDEVAKLLAGETISFEARPRENKPFPATGALGVGTFKGRKFVGFQLEVPDKPTKWSGRTFTPAEVAVLLAGQALEIDDFVSARTGKTFGCKVTWDAKARKITPDFGSDDEPPRSWCQVTFTDAQRKDLAAGKTIQGTGFVSARGRPSTPASPGRRRAARRRSSRRSVDVGRGLTSSSGSRTSGPAAAFSRQERGCDGNDARNRVAGRLQDAGAAPAAGSVRALEGLNEQLALLSERLHHEAPAVPGLVQRLVTATAGTPTLWCIRAWCVKCTTRECSRCSIRPRRRCAAPGTHPLGTRSRQCSAGCRFVRKASTRAAPPMRWPCSA
ncbi:hypothetical protein ACIQNK_33605 [Streptomyces sp. NPDC091273]|uniref:hypothetical protein n=1 Tax=Streptomyces sp. NPDC091273 TaxID=3365982 RepID=UPI003800703B